MTDEDARIDPRYDPAFQRGFDGEVVSGARRRNAAVMRSAVTSSAPYRPAEDSVPDGDEPVDLDEVRPTRAAQLAGQDTDAVTADYDDQPYRPRGTRGLVRNPFVVALMALGVLLLIGGIAWFNLSRAMVSATVTSELDYWLLQTSVVGAPIIFAAGAVVAAALLVMFARAWERG